MGPRSNRIMIVVFPVRAYYVSRKVANTGGVLMTLAGVCVISEDLGRGKVTLGNTSKCTVRHRKVLRATLRKHWGV